MVRLVSTLALTGLAALAVGCDESHPAFQLHQGWREAGPQECPSAAGAAASCRDIPLTCDVHVRVRIIGVDAAYPYYSECFPVHATGDACALGELTITPHAVPTEEVRVQLAVWTDAELARHGYDPALATSCPDTPAFAGGLIAPPDATIPGPVAALGGEARFMVGASAQATVDLGCPGWATLDDDVCRADQLTLDAQVRDLTTLDAATATTAGDLQLSVGEPHATDDGYELAAGTIATPTPPQTAESHWTVRVARDRQACLRVEKVGGVPTLRCVDAAALPWPVAKVDGYDLSPELLAKALARAGLAAPPAAGFVVGVVLDADGAPVAGAQVTTSDDEVRYLGDDATPTRTGSDGLFMATAAPFGSPWRAVGPGQVADDGTALGGLIADHISIVVLRLVAPPPPPTLVTPRARRPAATPSVPARSTPPD